MKLPAQYAKAITAVIGQVLVYLQWKYGASGAQWLPIVLAAASAYGVYAIPNAPKPSGVITNTGTGSIPQPGSVTILPPPGT